MPSTPESRFSQRVREGLKSQGCAVERIENRVTLGMPDMLVGLADHFVMLELKAITKGLAVNLSPHQVAFLTRHGRAGRRCFVLTRDEGNTKRPPSVALYSGLQAFELAQAGLRVAPIMSWPDRAVDWTAVVELLSAGFDPLKKTN